MAFTLNTLVRQSASANSDAPVLWCYASTADAIATINTAGYFNTASGVLKVGDIIFVRDSAGVMSIVYVNANAAGVVDVTDGLTITATDTD